MASDFFQFIKMNLVAVSLFSAALLFSQVITVALVTYFLGAPSFEKWNPLDFLLILNGPVCFVSSAIFYFLARKGLPRPYIHAFFVLFVADFLDIFATLLITKQLFYLLAWMVGLPLSMFALFVGTVLGIKHNQWQRECEAIK